MQLSANGVKFLKDNEGFVSHVQDDTGGKLVIGYGHDLLPGETFPDGITEAQGAEILAADVAKWEKIVNRHVGPGCTQGQFDALIDFTHECGEGALEQLLAHGWSQVPLQLPRWIHARVKGVMTVLAGMVARREKEIKLWNGESLD